MRNAPTGLSGRYLSTLFEAGAASGLSDGQLLERFATESSETAELAFTALLERHGPMVLRVCRGILRDEHEARDAFQVTFLVLVRKARSLWVRDSLGPWLHQVACRAAARARAAADRRRALERRAAEWLEARSTVREPDDIAAVVHQELTQLPERYRAPIVLVDLEGCTCEQAARHIGCPIGTVGSRLARGRERLRAGLVRRGLGPAVGALASVLTSDSDGAVITAALTRSTLSAATGIPSVSVSHLANLVSRTMLMTKWITIAAACLTVGGLSLSSVWAVRSVAIAQAPTAGRAKPAPAGQAKPEPKKLPPQYAFAMDPERHRGTLMGEIGNMRPLVQDDLGVHFQSRQAAVFKDGTAKLWRLDQKDPIVPPLRHKGPIRELTFFDESSLLITMSDDSVKVWDALTGAPRGDLAGQVIRPVELSFAPGAKRFVTIASDRSAVTVWDTTTVKPVATLRLDQPQPLFDAGLSSDGNTVVTFTFGKDAAARLWDVATGSNFATLRPPAPAAVEIFGAGGAGLNMARLSEFKHTRDTPFWALVRSLAPAGRDVAKDQRQAKP